MTAAGYDHSVFINCPYDSRYRPHFRATVFTVQQCGFYPRCALEVEDSGEERFRKIKRIIRECRYGIHDISRVQLDPATGFPRFNMPLELGLFLGAQEYGGRVQKSKRSLVLDAEPFRYQKFCSDIAGQDVRAHANQTARIIAAVRAMLATALDGEARVPGEARIRERYSQFREELPVLCGSLAVKPSELQFVEYRYLVQSWIRNNPLVR
ncbi:MAG TPA: hypothetical protein VFR81_14160 [Longimicrobium sp.]|nr:hypothetical protein [Longimicrobium sp.]